MFALLFQTLLSAQEPKPKLILEVDTANEIDDQYAIIRMLKQDKFNLIGLTSAQWLHYLGDQESVLSCVRRWGIEIPEML